MSRIQVEKFLGYTDLPLYGRDPGWCASLVNMRVMPGGYLEARGGMDKIKPSGGTAADVTTAGVATGAHEHTLPNVGWVVLATTGGTVFSTNQALKAYYYLWAATATQHDAIYIGSDTRFSRVIFYNNGANGAPTAPTYEYEYSTSAWTTSAGSDLTLTSTPSFNPGASTFGEQLLEFAVPSDWTAQVINGVLQYWIRIRVTNSPTAWGTRPAQAIQRVYADWQGDRQIYVSVADGSAGAANAAVKRYGQSGTTTSWTSIDSSLFSGNNARTRFASYRGVLYYVNGKEQRRWNQDTAAAIGFTEPTCTGTGDANDLTAANTAAGVLNGTFSYAITYGYGPAGEWGESNERVMGWDGAAANSYITVASRQITVTFNLASIPTTGIADYIYVYRTADLASVPAAVRTSAPFYRIATVKRDSATGVFPTTYVDGATGTSTAFPFPPVPLNIATNTPPSRCRFIAIHKNRMFLGSNNQYPGRVWWSEAFQPEAFITDENFADFTRQTGGILTGLIEFADQIVVFTEDNGYGIANVDTDAPDIYEIPGMKGIGCIAPDAVCYGAGELVWPGRNGIYAWDGNNPVRRISDDTSATFGKMSLETHGGSRAVIHDRMYTITLATSNDTVVSSGTPFRYDLVSKSWGTGLFGDSTISKLGPFLAVSAPLGHADAGVRHSLWAPIDKATTVWPVYLGEYTTADNGSSFTLRAEVHLGPKGYVAFSPDRIAAYYEDGSGGSLAPTLTMPNTTYQWAGGSSMMKTDTYDSGQQYRLVENYVAEKSTGTGGILVRWNATQAAGGTLNGSRLHAIYMDGDGLEPIRR